MVFGNFLQNNCKCKQFAFTLHKEKLENMESIENIKHAGLKLTPQRRMIYEAMMQLRHATLDDIEEHLKSEGTLMTTSTVYRVLDSFCRANLLSLFFHPETGKGYYDITTREHHHIFSSNQVSDFEAPGLSVVVRDYLRKQHIPEEDIEKVQVQITTIHK